MYRRLCFRWLPIRRLQKECVVQAARAQQPASTTPLPLRPLSTSLVWCKKRKSVEERAVENSGRRVIRYSPKAGSAVVGIWRDMTVRDIAHVLGKDVDHVLRALEFADKTSDTRYSADTVVRSQQVVRDVVKICGCRFRLVAPPHRDQHHEQDRDVVSAPPAAEESLRPRPPVVCVMGHVDHGKTTLLDALRGSSVAAQESGGITQHIGAFQVCVGGGESITFLDTPGHAAFTAMRQRGAHATDLVVLVVAADDGVMDQTVEAVRMATQARVPIVVAINKIDKPDANIERTVSSLARAGVVCESVGGDVQAVCVSARRGDNLPALLDALAAQAHMMELRADYAGQVEGVVLEARLDPRAGRQATVLVRRGTLRRGDVIVAGTAYAKVRAMQGSDGRPLDAAPPACPAAVWGWRDLPAPGDTVLQVPTEKRAHEVVRHRAMERMRAKQAADAPAVEEAARAARQHYEAERTRRRAMGRMRAPPATLAPPAPGHQHDTPTLTVIVKGDAEGSVEAIAGALNTYHDHDRVRLALAHAAVGPPTPSDLQLAEAFSAIVYLFNVAASAGVAAEARRLGITLRRHDVIYKLIDDVRAEISARIPPTQQEEVIGEANVVQLFSVSEGGRRRATVAGCRCVRGALRADARYKVLRGEQVIYDGKVVSMKHHKDEVGVIKRDQECGVRLADPAPELQPGDTLRCYTTRDVHHDTDWDPGF